MNRSSWLEYVGDVLEYLEHLGYPEYVQFYAPESVARTLVAVEKTFYDSGLSHRMCAITIFALTLDKINRELTSNKIM